MAKAIDLPLTPEEIEGARLRAAGAGETSALAHVRASLTPAALEKAARLPARRCPESGERVRVEIDESRWFALARVAMASGRKLPDLAAAALALPGPVASPPADDDLPRAETSAARAVAGAAERAPDGPFDLGAISRMAMEGLDLADAGDGPEAWRDAVRGFEPGERYGGPIRGLPVGIAGDEATLEKALAEILPSKEHAAACEMNRVSPGSDSVDGIAAVAILNDDGTADLEARVGARAPCDALPYPAPGTRTVWSFPAIRGCLIPGMTARQLLDGLRALRIGMETERRRGVRKNLSGDGT